MSRFRAALLDMNAGYPNQGMRCIKELFNQYIDQVDWEVFDVRTRNEIPDLSYDLYVSSGGPGSPLEGDGVWDRQFFDWIDKLWQHNQNPAESRKKHVFFICHSYQMACRFFKTGTVGPRSKRSFGVLPVYPTHHGRQDPVLGSLDDPFYAVDVRDFQVTDLDEQHLASLGGEVLAIERPRKGPGLPRAIMSIRFSDEMMGTQFHPEADAEGMSLYYQMPEKKRETIDTYGEEIYYDIISHLNDPDKVKTTHATVLPNFIDNALKRLAAHAV